MGTVAGGLAIAGTAASVLGTGVSVVGAMQQADAQKRAASYQAKVAENNATIAAQNARTVQNQAEVRAAADQRAGAMRAGAQRAAMAANGVGLDSGSALDVQDSTARTNALQAENDRYQGQLAAYGYAGQSSNFMSDASMSTMKGEAANDAGMWGAGASLLSGASQVSSKWAAWQRADNGTGRGGG